MNELRYTDTNAADDSAGRAFGLDGNLYLPVLIAVLVALGGFAVLGLVLRVNFIVAGIMVAVPLTVVLAWAFCLKQGKPAGYDRDMVEHLLGGDDFTRIDDEQGRLVV